MTVKEAAEYMSNPRLLSSAVFDKKAREAIRVLVKHAKDSTGSEKEEDDGKDMP